MLISLNWLKELVDISGLTTNELAEIITKTGIEVDGVYEPEDLPKDVVVGNVLSCEQHPNADKLSLCQVDVGEETLQIAVALLISEQARRLRLLCRARFFRAVSTSRKRSCAGKNRVV